MPAATAPATDDRFTTMLDQAVQTFGDALKAGVKVQEQVASFWTDALDKATPSPEWQKKSRSFVGEVVPAAQKNAEEWLKLMEQNYRRSMDLLKKAFDAGATASVTDLQSRTQALWESSLELVRENAQAMAKSNSKVMELWADLFKQTTAAAASASKEK